jgi:hypothetical protein
MTMPASSGPVTDWRSASIAINSTGSGSSRRERKANSGLRHSKPPRNAANRAWLAYSSQTSEKSNVDPASMTRN